MAVNVNGFLGRRQRQTCRNFNLPLDQVEPGDHFSHRVLHLQAGVHFHEIELAARIQQKLNRASAHIIHGLGHLHRCSPKGFTLLLSEPECGRFLNHFLVAALCRAIAFEQMHYIAVGVGKHLHFHMARLDNLFFKHHRGVAKCVFCLALTTFKCGLQIACTADNSNALATTAGHRLDHQRKTDSVSFSLQGSERLVCAKVTRNERYTRWLHAGLGLAFAAHDANGLHTGANEGDVFVGTSLREGGILGQKTVARVNGLRTGLPGCCNHFVDIQVALRSLGLAKAHRFIAFLHMQGLRVSCGIHRHGLNTHGLRGAVDSAGYFATVGNQYFGEHCVNNLFSQPTSVCVFP